jgi:hypothetical protein
MNVNRKLKRYKIIFESLGIRTPGDSMDSKGRMGVKLELIYVHTKKYPYRTA